jgi:flagellar hook assembly protein FlgD
MARETTRHPRLRRGAAAAAIVTVALLAAVWTAPRASGGVAAWLRTPPVQMKSVAPPGGSLDVRAPNEGARSGLVSAASRVAPGGVTVDGGMTFTMVGVVCDAPSDGVPVVLHLRTSADGESWGQWREAPLEVDGGSGDDSGDRARAYIDPVWTGDARFVEVSATADAAGASRQLTGARVVAIDPTGSAGATSAVAGTIRRLVARVAGVSLVPAASAATSAPRIVLRSQWGADESLRKDDPAYATVKMAFIHHTASGNTYSRDDAPALVRGIYAYHTRSLGWDDIGYNFLIDRYGTIYEGRYGGITRGVVGAQVLGFNTGSTGVSVIGTFTAAPPPAEALTALERLLAWKLGVHGLDPAGTARLTCGAAEKYAKGTVVAFPVIAGHRQANSTECPGTAFYALLPDIRSDVARRMRAAAEDLSAGAAAFSPNGDGVLDTLAFTADVSPASGWTLTIRGPAGAAVATWSGTGSSVSVTWNGAGASGDTVPDGAYVAELTASSGLMATTPSTVGFGVDTVPPRLAGATATPASFSPNGDGQSETATVSYRPAEPCAVRVGILDAEGAVRRWLHGWRTRGAEACSATWNGALTRNGKQVAATDGRYRFVVERRDEVGNIARQGCKVTLDRTLGSPTATPVTISPNGDGRRDVTTLGFRLTRRATVTITVRLGADVVRTLQLGALGAGARTATWDGTSASGDALGSGRPVATISATSSLGDTSVTRALVVDRYRPRLSAPASATVRLGAAAATSVTASDPFSAKVDLRYKVVDRQGRAVATAHPGWIDTGLPFTVSWRPKARGTFTIVFSATDLGENHESAPARTTLTVR